MVNIDSLIDSALLSEEISRGFVKVREHPTLPLHILNYTPACMFEKRWNGATETCRGLIIHHPSGEVVARPWRKFYNLGEKATLIGSHDTVEITDKADGSLGIGYPTPEGYAVATRGSFSSDQALWATDWLRDSAENGIEYVFNHGITPLFEIVYPKNRIVLNYGDFEGLILLGGVNVLDGTMYGPNEAAEFWTGERTRIFPERTIAEFMAGPNAQRSNAEGVVARAGHRMLKIKQQAYIDLHRIVTGLSTTSVWEMLGDGYTVQEICEPLPDEFHDWVRKLASELTFELEQIQFKLADEFVPLKELDRKTFALSIVNHPLRPWLFLMYDGKDTTEAIWRTLKPAHEGRWG